MRINKRFGVPILLSLVLAAIFLGMGVTNYFYRTTLSSGSFVGDEPLKSFLERDLNEPSVKAGNAQWILNGTLFNQNSCLIYFHGFSASPREISPVTEVLSNKWNIPAFFPRLTGHGLQSDEIQSATAEDWLADAEATWAAAKSICPGKIHLIGTSTGALLSIHLAKKYPQQTGHLVLISPNFKLKNEFSFLIHGPFAGLFRNLFVGNHREFKPRWKDAEHFWTTRYQSRALTEMLRLQSYVNSIPISEISAAILFLVHPNDSVVSTSSNRRVFDQIKSARKEWVEVLSRDDHVLAGEIASPESTNAVVSAIEHFFEVHGL